MAEIYSVRNLHHPLPPSQSCWPSMGTSTSHYILYYWWSCDWCISLLLSHSKSFPHVRHWWLGCAQEVACSESEVLLRTAAAQLSSASRIAWYAVAASAPLLGLPNRSTHLFSSLASLESLYYSTASGSFRQIHIQPFRTAWLQTYIHILSPQDTHSYLVRTTMADGSSHPPPKRGNQGPSASTSGNDVETKPDALDSVISPQKAVPHHLEKPNTVKAVDVKFDKEKIFAEIMSDEVNGGGF